MALIELFHASRNRSIKWDSYFRVYEELLQRLRGKTVTLFEIGLMDGGSLFMWRQFLGPQARIIGIDLNPQCRELEKDGFEIFIGNQSQPEFWSDFYAKVGKIDVLIDDGGHSNHNQLATLVASIDNIRDGGLVLIEDIHASYMRHFGNPCSYSFINRCKQAVDEINARHPWVNKKQTPFSKAIYSIAFYESIVAFQVNRSLCVVPEAVANDGLRLNTADQNHISRNSVRALGRYPRFSRLISWASSMVFVRLPSYVKYCWENSRLGCYFR